MLVTFTKWLLHIGAPLGRSKLMGFGFSFFLAETGEWRPSWEGRVVENVGRGDAAMWKHSFQRRRCFLLF